MTLKKITAGAMAAALSMAGITAIVDTPQAEAAAAAGLGFDYNGDGYADLAVAAPVEDVVGATTEIDAGAVTVLYGTANGLGGLIPYTVVAGDTLSSIAAGLGTTTTVLTDLNPGIDVNNLTVGSVVNGPTVELTQGLAGVPDEPEDDDRFGETIASGDLNGDGYDDLVVSAFKEDIGALQDAGSVTVFYGGPNGIGRHAVTAMDQDSPGVPGLGEEFDSWGQSLVVADMNGDDFDDLFVGAPLEGLGTRFRVGAVTMLPGSAAGVTTTGAKLLIQGSGGVPGLSEAEDGWGLFLASTDINGDGFEDLVVGAPFENIGTIADAGAVTIVFGSAAGPNGGQLVWQGKVAAGKSEAGDKFGRVAAGDLNGDGFGDVVIGAPFENISTIRDPGAIGIVYGSATGLTSSGRQLLWQRHLGTPGLSENDDQWGSVLEVADVNGDQIDDVIIGTPEEDVNVPRTGAVTLLYGTASGVSPTGGGLFHQNSAGFPGSNQNGDRMGAGLAAGDYNGDGIADIAIGIVSDDSPIVPSSGSVVILNGDSNGVTTAGALFIDQDTDNVPGENELGDSWGSL